MATVWADITGIWAEGTVTPGWSHALAFRDLDELVKKLGDAKPSIKNQVTKLAIVAHGNQGGLVQLNRDLTAGSASSFKEQFSRVNDFLAPFARLIFYSCVAGAGIEGSKLLNALSQTCLPHKYVIGFEVFGYAGKFLNLPGRMQAVETSDAVHPTFLPADSSSSSQLSEYSWYSKWSLDGTIIKLPRNEQESVVRADRASHGVKSVHDVIGRHRNDVKFVAIEKDLATTSALRGVVDAVGRAHLDSGTRLRFLSRSELTRLAKTPAHEGAVVVWSEGSSPMKCANPKCPGHARPWHFCSDYAKQFPMGPLQ